MAKDVIFRDRQELQAADLNAVEAFTGEEFVYTRLDVVGDGQYYSGLQVTQYSPTEIQVASGRYWSNGKVYVREVDVTQPELQTNVFSVLAFLPSTHRRIVAVIAYGTEIETDVQPRDFLINLETGATEPQAVPMQALRLANIQLVAGVESPTPQLPLIPTGTVLVATVLLGTNGIVEIAMSTNSRVPSINSVRLDLTQLLVWKSLIEPQLTALRTDLAALWEAIASLANRDRVTSLSFDVAYIKERLQLPDNFSSYAADIFVNEDESDTGYFGYDAFIKDGLNFPKAAQTTINLALLNPADPTVERAADNSILPKYTIVKRLETTQYSGDMNLNYQVQSLNYQVTQKRCGEFRYGYTIPNVEGWWTKGYNRIAFGDTNIQAHNGKLQHKIYWEKYSLITWEGQTYVIASTQTIVGSLTAQTFLVSNGMWLVQAGFFFTTIGDGDVTLMVTETVNGKPDLKRTMATVTIPQSTIKTYPTETTVRIPPVFLEPGKRYAFCLVVQGNYKVATVYGAAYTEGSLFISTDSEFFAGELGRDLMFTVYGARFNQSRLEVAMQPLSLAGGISDILIHTPIYAPRGSALSFEFQVNGQWKRMDEEIYNLSGLPDLIPLRAVMLGTSDIAPTVKLGTNVVSGWRLKTAFKHISSARTPSGPVSAVTVKLQTSKFLSANHTLSCKLVKSDDSRVTPTVSTIEDEGDGLKRHKFVFALSPTISTYRIEIGGTRTNAATEPFSVIDRIDVTS